MFTPETVKQELEKIKSAAVTSRNANDYAALLIIGDHLSEAPESAEGHQEAAKSATAAPRNADAHFDRETAERWVRGMQNEDASHPVGGKWSPDMLKPLAQKYGMPTDGQKFWELYAMTNAMYSDYSEVARKFGVTSPEFYVCMAKAWMDDKDAEPDKTALYYDYIVRK